MVLLILFGIFFVIWLFSSKTKKEDLSNLGDSISKGLDSLNESLDNLNKELKVQTKQDEIQRFYKLLKTLNHSNNLRNAQGLAPRSIQDFFESDLELKEYTELEEYVNLVRKERLALVRQELKDIGTDNYIPFSNQTNPKPIENCNPIPKSYPEQLKVEHKKKVPIDVEKLKAEKQKLVNILINASLPEEKLVNFIYVRYLLTGNLNYPNLKCVNDCLLKMTPELPQKHLHFLWQKVVRELNFDETKRKKIDSIYHFTHITNLYSILGYGLLTRDFLENSGMNFMFNDTNRWDNVRDSISLSFSHPNYRMFFKYRNQTENADWVVLKINTELLSGNTNPNLSKLNEFDYLNKAIFCVTNGASIKVKNIPIAIRKSYKTFLELFESPIGKTLPTYTVDNQAEILFQGNIPKDFIVEIYTQAHDLRLEWVKEFGYNVIVKPQVFMKR